MSNPLYLRYLAASAASLAVDFGIFIVSLALGAPAAAAAAIGYIAGVICHWLISSRAVFVGRLAEAGPGRRQQQALFLTSAVVGLGMTTAIVGVAARFGFDPRLAKCVAIVVSFQTTYLLRKRLVFA